MKTDLDTLMTAQNLDGLLVLGRGQHNPPMVYMTGGAHLTNAVLLKPRDQPPILFYNSMERDEAAQTGLLGKDLSQYRFDQLLKEAHGDRLAASAELYKRILEEVGITSGRLAIYGRVEIGSQFAVLTALAEKLPALKIVGEVGDPVLLQAMATKDEVEVDRIRRMGQKTTKVVGMVAEFLVSRHVQDEVLVDKTGKPVTVGDVKRRINLWLAAEGAQNPEGTIFAIGHDAGVPHSSGNPQDVLRLGQTIVFDIFPCEPGGGYFFDFTRTWCLGYAPDEVQAVYDDVLAVYQQIMRELQVHHPCKPYQKRVCELFEARGHPTLESDPQTQSGYVHSLGHGLGLYVHERPNFGHVATEADRLDPGVVVTIEPGLYYPERGLGVRLENTVYVRPDGEFEVLAEYPMDLVLPMQITS